jgi:predicted O-linked N-acetylglucosamine transferase (SPINDLY family)
MSTMAAADVVLDPLYFGGCNSSCEAIALGVPVVTLPGTHLFGRFTRGLYQQMQLLDCVADSIEAYADHAVRIGTDRAYREHLVREINARSPVLFDRTDFTLAFAEFIERKVSTECLPAVQAGG